MVMFDIFRKEKVVSILMLSFFVSSILVRLLLWAVFQRMIKETDNMAVTSNKLLKQCKMKFANCYQLNNGVANISVFVDKFLNRLYCGPFSFEMLYHLSGQLMLLSVMSAGIGICKSIMDGKMLGEIIPFYIVSFLELYVYFSISTLVNLKGKKRILKINLVDYLENHFAMRMNVTEQDMERLYGDAQQREGYPKENGVSEEAAITNAGSRTDRGYQAAGRDRNRQGRASALQEGETRDASVERDNGEELETLLKDFLTV